MARAFVDSLDQHNTFGQRYNLCGPKQYTLREIVEYLAQLLGKRVMVIGLNDMQSYLQALVMEFAPGKPFSLDNYRSLKLDSICREGFPQVFGFAPIALESVAPAWIASRR